MQECASCNYTNCYNTSHMYNDIHGYLYVFCLSAGHMLTAFYDPISASWIKFSLCLSEWDQIWNVDSL